MAKLAGNGKCWVCEVKPSHVFRECASQDCNCGCVSQLKGTPASDSETKASKFMPRWFRVVPRHFKAPKVFFNERISI